MKLIMTTLNKEKSERSAKVAIKNCGVKDVELVLGVNKPGEGYVTGTNKALSQVIDNPDYVCLLNDDSIPVTDNWLAILLEEMNRSENLKVWFAGPSGGCRTYPQNAGRIGDKRRPRLVRHLAGFCMLCHPNVLKKVGLMNKDYHHYAGEIDWQWRATATHTARCLWVPSVFVKHEVHQTNSEWWQRDQQLLDQIWKGEK